MICRSVEYVEQLATHKAPPLGFLDATPSLAELLYAVRLSSYYHVRLASHPSKHSPYVSTVTSQAETASDILTLPNLFSSEPHHLYV
jgi:hypothetical protein